MLQYTALDATMAAHTNITHIYLCFSSSVEKPRATATFALCQTFHKAYKTKTRRSQRAEPSPARGGRVHSVGTFTRRLCDIFGIFSSESIEKQLQQQKKLQDGLFVLSGRSFAGSARDADWLIQVDLTQHGAFAVEELEGRRASPASSL